MCFYYVTLYQSKHNQNEESHPYHNVCVALAKRIQRQNSVLMQEAPETMEEAARQQPDFCEGLKRVLSAMYAHTSKNVLSATMASHIISRGSRFHYSHDFQSIPTTHLIQWMTGEGELEFKIKRVKNDDGSWGTAHDIFINDYIYRPVELEKFGCYELMSKYEKKKIQKKKNGDHNVESKKKLQFYFRTSIS